VGGNKTAPGPASTVTTERTSAGNVARTTTKPSSTTSKAASAKAGR
jgi:hypothetical protein